MTGGSDAVIMRACLRHVQSGIIPKGCVGVTSVIIAHLVLNLNW